jgi:hypothetical protein
MSSEKRCVSRLNISLPTIQGCHGIDVKAFLCPQGAILEETTFKLQQEGFRLIICSQPEDQTAILKLPSFCITREQVVPEVLLISLIKTGQVHTHLIICLQSLVYILFVRG